MAESNWKIRMMLFVRAVDVTHESKAVFGAIFANNGSGETIVNESKLFDAAIRLSASGELPAQAFGLETALLLPDMRADMIAFLDTLPQSLYYVIANTELPQFFAGELIQDNRDPTLAGVPPWDTEVFTMADALADIEDERGLIVIPDDD